MGMSTTRTDVPAPAATAHSGGYVLPKPARPANEFVLPGARPMPRALAAEVARAIGHRTSALLECQARLLDELRQGIGEIDADLGDATRARLRGLVKNASSVLDWCGAVQADLARESAWAARGLQPIELQGFLRELQGSAGAAGTALQLRAEREVTWWGDGARLGEVMVSALDLVRARVGGSPSALIELQEAGPGCAIRVAGLGAVAAEIDAALVESFRHAVALLGARVTPDPRGPAGTGFVLQLPLPE
jgi:hypothetical protein